MAQWFAQFIGEAGPDVPWTFGLYLQSPDSIITVTQAADQSADVMWGGSSPSGDDELGRWYNDRVTMNRVRVSEVDPPGGIGPLPIEVVASRPGASASASLPYQCSVCITNQSSLSTRRFRGRTFLPAPSIDVLAISGRLTSVARAGIADAVANLHLSLRNRNCVPLVRSRAQDAFVAITSIRVGDVVDTQRRRRDRLQEDYTFRETTL